MRVFEEYGRRLRSECQQLKVWLKACIGSQDETHGEYNVCIIRDVRKALRKSLRDEDPVRYVVPYCHLLELMGCLENFNSKEKIADLDIIEKEEHSLFVLRDRRGPLVRREVQLVFGLVPRHREIIVLEWFDTWADIPDHTLIALYQRYFEYVRSGREHGWAIPVHKNLARL